MKPKEKDPAVRTGITAIDFAQDCLDEIEKDSEAANEKARATIEGLHKERAGLKGEHDAIAGRLAGMKADYARILDETMAAEAKTIGAKAVTKADLQAGRVTVPEFLKVGKDKETIDHEARLAATEKMATIRDAIRPLRVQQYELAAKIAGVEEKISQQFSFVAANFWHKLDSMKKGLEERGITASGILQTHAGKREADNDLGMARAGAVIFHAKQWTVRSLQDFRLLALDPIVQPAHYDELEKLAVDLTNRDFPLEVNYLPAAAQGRGPGFWFYLRPKF